MNNNAPVNPEVTGIAVGRSVVVYLLQLAVMLAVASAIMFGISWRLDWVGAWLLLGISGSTQLIGLWIILATSPDLLDERAAMQEGTKEWDKPLMLHMGMILPLTSAVVAGVDKRLGWSPELPLWLVAAALAVSLVGILLAFWALGTNRFFSATVRIQSNRGHHVIDRGPYAIVRHPGYLGGFLLHAMMPLILGTLWVYVVTALYLAVTVIRTRLEDATLQEELPGYSDYARRVRYRLLPGVW